MSASGGTSVGGDGSTTEPRIAWPSRLVEVLKANCESSGLVNRAALSFEKNNDSPAGSFVVSLDVKHGFLLQKLSESLQSRVSTLEAEEDRPAFPVLVEGWSLQAEKLAEENPASVFFASNNSGAGGVQ